LRKSGCLLVARLFAVAVSFLHIIRIETATFNPEPGSQGNPPVIRMAGRLSSSHPQENTLTAMPQRV
jgi:hypothetical protein